MIKRIKGCSRYFISDDGKVYSNYKRKGSYYRILKTALNRKGYEVTGIKNDLGKRVTKTIHRLVAEHFIENPLNKPQINHINGIKIDNRVENLEWVTNKENVEHAVKLGIFPKGETHARTKLMDEDIKKIIHYRSLSYTHKKIADVLGVARCTITNYLNGRGRINILT